jgi:ribosomal-protein-alanine N-acetyltransferase
MIARIENIYTDRLELFPLNLKFCSEIYLNWMNDPEIYQYLESGGDYSMQKLKEYLKQVENNPCYFWAICIKESNQHIGNIKIDPINFKHGNGEYGIMMGDKAEWNKGYAKEASNSVIQFCFNTLKLRKIYLGVIEDNIGAVNLYKKIGFEFEGYFKDYGIYNNKYCNMFRMTLTNPNLKL